MMRLHRRLLVDHRGDAAVDFAIFAPVLLLLFVGITDIGRGLYLHFRLAAAANAAGAYAMTMASKVESTDGAALAASLAGLARSDNGVSVSNVAVSVNNGPTATASGTSAAVQGGSAAAADLCWCPSAAPFAWGTSVSCSGSCSIGVATPGKFVTISISQVFTPLFSAYGIVASGPMVVNVTVQVA